MGHGDEVVLAADAAHHAAARERVRHRRAEQCDHHAGIDEARGAALQDTQLLVRAVELIDETDAAHAKACAVTLRQLTQRSVEAAWAEEEAGMQHLSIAQAAAEAWREARAARGVRQVGRQPLPTRQAHASGVELDAIKEYSVMLQQGELVRLEVRPRAGLEQVLENARIDALADRSRRYEPLERQAVVHLAAQDAGTIELEQVIDEHLRGGEQARDERFLPAFLVDERGGTTPTKRGARGAPGGVLLVPQQQRIHHGAAELTDSDLQRAAIAQQSAHVQADGVLDRADGRVRRT